MQHNEILSSHILTYKGATDLDPLTRPYYHHIKICRGSERLSNYQNIGSINPDHAAGVQERAVGWIDGAFSPQHTPEAMLISTSYLSIVFEASFRDPTVATG